MCIACFLFFVLCINSFFFHVCVCLFVLGGVVFFLIFCVCETNEIVLSDESPQVSCYLISPFFIFHTW